MLCGLHAMRVRERAGERGDRGRWEVGEERGNESALLCVCVYR